MVKKYIIKDTDNNWVKWVKKYANENKITYMCAIEGASKTYKKVPKVKKKKKSVKKPIVEDKIEFDFITDLYNFVDKQGVIEKPIAFKGTPLTSALILIHILKRHNNDCILMNDEVNFSNWKFGITITKRYGSISKTDTVGTIEEIMTMLKECGKEKNNFVLMPFHLPGHANVLIYNPYTDEIEHIEPHGQEYRGKGKSYSIEKMRKALTKFFESKKAQKILKVKVLTSDKTCPYSKGVQSYIHRDKKKGTKYNGVYLKDPGGFCVAWSYFIADFRMYHPKLTMNEVRAKAQELLKQDVFGKFTEFIRSYSRLFLVELHTIYELGKDYFILDDQIEKWRKAYNKDFDPLSKKMYETLKNRKNIAKDKINDYLKNEIKKSSNVMEI
jgi:hypothetical protein